MLFIKGGSGGWDQDHSVLVSDEHWLRLAGAWLPMAGLADMHAQVQT